MEQQPAEPKPQSRPQRAAYEPPAVILEAALEVRAGSPLGILGQLKKVASPADPAGLWRK